MTDGTGTGRRVGRYVAAIGLAAAIGAAGGYGSMALGDTGRAPRVAVGHAAEVTRHVPVTTSTTAPYTGPVAFIFARNLSAEDAPETVAALAQCAVSSDDCWYSPEGTVTGNVSAALTLDLITCAQSHAVDCHVERDSDGTRSVYGGPGWAR